MANRERRKGAVFTPTMVPASAIAGCRCAWRDCGARFKGDLPGGWRLARMSRAGPIAGTRC